MGPEQTARKLFAADDFSRRHFQMHFFLGALRVKTFENQLHTPSQASLVFFNPSCTPFTEWLLLSYYYNNIFHAYIPW